MVLIHVTTCPHCHVAVTEAELDSQGVYICDNCLTEYDEESDAEECCKEDEEDEESEESK